MRGEDKQHASPFFIAVQEAVRGPGRSEQRMARADRQPSAAFGRRRTIAIRCDRRANNATRCWKNREWRGCTTAAYTVGYFFTMSVLRRNSPGVAWLHSLSSNVMPPLKMVERMPLAFWIR